MRMHIDYNFKFHPVGFGLFTSGKIENFRFVYDCGTKSTQAFVENAIDSEFQAGDVIDLLVISHFHKDHISGIKKLLETVDQVKTIVLPYFTPADRLVYILSLYSTPEENEERTDDNISWILQFISDPIKYLLENYGNKIEIITLINGGDNSFNAESDPQNDKQSNNSSDVFRLSIDDLNNSNNSDEIKSNEEITDTKVSVKEYGLLKLKGTQNTSIWQFIFYCPILNDEQKKYFKGILESVGINSDELITKAALLDIVEKVDFVEIAEKSGVSNNDINNTSLILYHSPICLNNPHRRFFEIYFKELHCHHFCNLNKEFLGFLYTGDINLKTNYVDISTYYQTLLDHICIYQIPHHGSIDNWENSISDRNPYSIHIASSDTTYVRKLHPNQEVLYDIALKKGLFIWCNELNPIEFYGRLWIH